MLINIELAPYDLEKILEQFFKSKGIKADKCRFKTKTLKNGIKGADDIVMFDGVDISGCGDIVKMFSTIKK